MTRFSSGSVKMGPNDIDEIKSRLRASNRESLDRLLTDKSSLGVLVTNVHVLSDLAMSPSFKLQEWALNALGERSPIPANAVSNLLTIVTNIQTDEHVRALAARVVTISNPDGRALGALVAQIPKASPEFQVLLIELIGLCGPKAQPVAGQLRPYLNASPAAVVSITSTLNAAT